MARENITLACTECKRRNYVNSRNKKTKTERLELKKYCPAERKHTTHREVK
jgi:large subunit ribosomal protein L33